MYLVDADGEARDSGGKRHRRWQAAKLESAGQSGKQEPGGRCSATAWSRRQVAGGTQMQWSRGDGAGLVSGGEEVLGLASRSEGEGASGGQSQVGLKVDEAGLCEERASAAVMAQMFLATPPFSYSDFCFYRFFPFFFFFTHLIFLPPLFSFIACLWLRT